MGAIEVAKTAQRIHGPAFDEFRGRIPLAVLMYWIARETTTRGRPFDRLALASDARLCESGWAQCPLYRAHSLAADPFETHAAAWLAGIEANDDANYWQRPPQDADPQRWRVAEWLENDDRNLWWMATTDYSIGTGALRRCADQATNRAKAIGRGPGDLGLMNEVIDWAEHTDLASPAHAGYWGRQTPTQILDRLRKKRDWIHETEQVGPIDGVEPGGTPPMERPSKAAPFPAELVGPALVIMQRDATTEECKRAWNTERAYVASRRAREFLPRKGIKATVKEWIANARPEPMRVLVERDWGVRATVSW
jgi:hypothetical protein